MSGWRVPFVVGSAVRLAYGLGAMLAPEWMGGRLAPTLRGHPDPRMNLRGFGGAQSAVAVYTLLTATTPERARTLLHLNALVDGFDAGVSLLERRDRGRFDEMAAGGVAVNVAGLTCWTLAYLALRRTRGAG
ncbi:MAG: hypothetical protein M3134_00770 [Actinomycetota bacterium]|nr:hypothetical protein [Actinomycetota bacterium]